MKKQNKGYLYKNLRNCDFKVDEIPLKEYPRPNLKRNSYLCLNGKWDIEINKDESLPKVYKNKVIVPYTIETPLSGVNHLLNPDEIIYYHKIINVKEFIKYDHIFINFDGVDQVCDIFINNKLVYSNDMPYIKFKVDVKKYIGNNSEFDLVVKVKDFTDSSFYSRGKQTLKPNFWFYTSNSGIYKSVWIEGVYNNYIEKIIYKTDYDNKMVNLYIETESDAEGIVYIDNAKFNIKTNTINKIDLNNNFKPWNTDTPYLYDVKIEVGNDVVFSYFGMRKIETKKVNNQYGIYLNNKRIFLNGLLDQGYYYLGFLTPKSNDDYLKDIRNVKELGYNCIRKHIKVESDLFYYYCDKEGILLIQDFPNGGYSYKLKNNFAPGISYKLFNRKSRLNYKGYGRKDKQSRDHFEKESLEIFKNLYNFPSIICFTIFNESWGEFDPDIFYKKFKLLDLNEHIFDTASGWIDTTCSDLFSCHAYYFISKVRKDPFNHRPYILSETGGIGFKVKEHYDYPKFYGHKNVNNKNDFNKKYKNMYIKNIIPMMKNGLLNGVIYTQLNDCEIEGNGIYTFDREYLKLDIDVVKNINKEINDLNK